MSWIRILFDDRYIMCIIYMTSISLLSYINKTIDEINNNFQISLKNALNSIIFLVIFSLLLGRLIKL